MVTFGSIIAHLSIVSVYFPIISSLALRRSHGYPILIHLQRASTALNSHLDICRIMRSVISSSPRGESWSDPSSSNILLSCLSIPIYARFPRDGSVGFSTIESTFPVSSRVKIPKFSGVSTAFTSAPYPGVFLSLSISFVSYISSPDTMRNSHSILPLNESIAEPVPIISPDCSM
jgi:hypothetical protein